VERLEREVQRVREERDGVDRERRRVDGELGEWKRKGRVERDEVEERLNGRIVRLENQLK